MRILLRFVAIFAFSVALFAATAVGLAPQARDMVTSNDAVGEEIDLGTLANRSYVYAADGTQLAVLKSELNREEVKLADIPDEVKRAIIITEDEAFYRHDGVNLRATFRALFANVEAGGVSQGGSTITQQLVKNALLSPERDVERKSKEAALALRLEKEMSKNEILERYLNTVYFGSSAYGLQAAAETYWGKNVGELGWSEAALLAGLIANPGRYDPTRFPEAARERRAIVAKRLVDEKVIDEALEKQINNAALPEERNINLLPPPKDYFVEAVKHQLLRDTRLGASYEERFNAVFQGGLKIYTTIDPAAQRAAEQARADILPKDDRPFTAVIVTVENATGAVRAMVGGPGFETYKYNVATNYPGRPPGSSMKTFVLLTALEQGYVPSDSVGGGGNFPNPGGKPYSVSGKGGTITSITQASSNGAFVRLGYIVGQDNVIRQARKMGMSSPFIPVPSLPLGAQDVIPIEMAQAYSSIPNGGLMAEYRLVERVVDRTGAVVFDNRPVTKRVISRQTACLTTEILKRNVEGGTGTRARLGDQDAAGKTGTTQDHADAWFVGFTPYVTTAVWMGAPDTNGIPMRNVGGITVFGGTYPARMWKQFMTVYHEGKETKEFPRCEQTRKGRFIKEGGGTTGTDPVTGACAPDPDDDDGGGNNDTGTRTDAPAGRGALAQATSSTRAAVKDPCKPAGGGTGTGGTTTSTVGGSTTTGADTTLGTVTTLSSTTSPPTTTPPTTTPPTTACPPPGPCP